VEQSDVNGGTGSPTDILVVDDEPHIGRIIKTRLEQGPFSVTVVERGAEALAALEQNPGIRLVVLDLMLPGMSGLEVLRAARANPQLPHLKCIVLTAAGQDAQFREAQQLGISEFMTKPFSPRRLFAHVLALTGQAEFITSSEESTL
jgi:two-component system alkaline phosphatase synthesis response regulator PhoP